MHQTDNNVGLVRYQTLYTTFTPALQIPWLGKYKVQQQLELVDEKTQNKKYSTNAGFVGLIKSIVVRLQVN
jgi:hypothetical protein